MYKYGGNPNTITEFWAEDVDVDEFIGGEIAEYEFGPGDDVGVLEKKLGKGGC